MRNALGAPNRSHYHFMKPKNKRPGMAKRVPLLARGSGRFYSIGRVGDLENGRRITQLEIVERIGAEHYVLLRSVVAATPEIRAQVKDIVSYLNHGAM